MTPYSQKDPKWARSKLGTCYVTIESDGCFCASLGMFADTNPKITNSRLSSLGGYANGCLVISEKAAKIMGLEYNGKSQAKPKHSCIAETDFYKDSGYTQHFFVLLKNGKILDPLDLAPQPKDNIYSKDTVSYRLFKPLKEWEEPNNSQEPMDKNAQKLIDKVGEVTGQNIRKVVNDTELVVSLKWLDNAKELQNKVIALNEEKEALKKQIQNSQKELEAVGIIIGLKNTLLKILNFK